MPYNDGDSGTLKTSLVFEKKRFDTISDIPNISMKLINTADNEILQSDETGGINNVIQVRTTESFLLENLCVELSYDSTDEDLISLSSNQRLQEVTSCNGSDS